MYENCHRENFAPCFLIGSKPIFTSYKQQQKQVYGGKTITGLKLHFLCKCTDMQLKDTFC